MVCPPRNIRDLQNIPSLQDDVKNTLEALVVSPEDEEGEDQVTFPEMNTTNSGKPTKKSDLLSKPHDVVLKKVIWPQQRLGVRHTTGKGLDFDSLDLRLLTVGEMEVISSGKISEYEKAARLNILKDILFNARFYDWAAVKGLYVAILTEVESGTKQWSNSISRLEQQVLMPFPIKRSYQSDKPKKSSATADGNKKSEKLYRHTRGHGCISTKRHRLTHNR